MEKRGLLIYPSTTPRGNNAFGWFREVAARHGMSVEVLFYDAPAAEAPAGAPAWKPDFVLMRGYNIALSRWYGAQGVPVLNAPEAMILCRDKLRCGEVLAAAGVPVPGALSPEEAGSGDAFPFILKLNFGSKGENVFLVRDAPEYRSALEACPAGVRGHEQRTGHPGVGDGGRGGRSCAAVQSLELQVQFRRRGLLPSDSAASRRCFSCRGRCPCLRALLCGGGPAVRWSKRLQGLRGQWQCRLPHRLGRHSRRAVPQSGPRPMTNQCVLRWPGVFLVLQSCPRPLAMVSSAAGYFCKHSVIRELRKSCDLFGML